jgi:hypothetical protein
MTAEPAEGAEVITVSTQFGAQHFSELLAAAERGAVVRVLDLRRPSVRAWISAERPAAIGARWADDMPLIEARTRRRQSRQARARHERAGRPPVGWHRREAAS